MLLEHLKGVISRQLSYKQAVIIPANHISRDKLSKKNLHISCAELKRKMDFFSAEKDQHIHDFYEKNTNRNLDSYFNLLKIFTYPFSYFLQRLLICILFFRII